MAAALGPEYFRRPATELAPDLLGKVLCRRAAGGTVRRRITETEAYFGEEDTACHASRGRTARSEGLYHAGGEAYVHRCHMYWLLTLVTGPEGHPEGVLVRGVEGAPGPGLASEALGVDRGLHGLPLSPESGLWVEDDGAAAEWAAGARVGIERSSPEDRARPWRFTAERIRVKRSADG